MHNLEKRMGIPPERHIWRGAIHRQFSKKKDSNGNPKLNIHAHVVMAERLCLDKPIIKECRARHYETYDIPKHKEIIYFTDVIKDADPNRSKESRGIFDSYAFSKFSNQLWRDLVKSRHLEKERDSHEPIQFKNHTRAITPLARNLC